MHDKAFIENRRRWNCGMDHHDEWTYEGDLIPLYYGLGETGTPPVIMGACMSVRG